MKKILVVMLVIVVVILLLVGCAPEPVHKTMVTTGLAQTGNMVYLPINCDGLPERNIEVIQSAVADWQKANSDKRVVSFQILYMQRAHSTQSADYTYGVELLFEDK